MKFDTIIMNPPYGLNNSIAKKIIKQILPISKTIINLVPKNTYKDNTIFRKVKEIKLASNAFKNLSVQDLSIVKLDNEYCNKDIAFESLKLSKKQLKLLKAVQNYNQNHKACYNALSGTNIGVKANENLLDNFLTKDYKKDLFTGIKDSTIGDARDNHLFFAITLWTPLDGVHTHQAHDWTYNLQDKWESSWNILCPVHILIFPNIEYRNNFREWWYSCLKKQSSSKKQRIGLTNAFLDLIRDAVSTSAGTYSYIQYFPHLNWSRSWTDEEILEEIGLPKDFLRKENN